MLRPAGRLAPTSTFTIFKVASVSPHSHSLKWSPLTGPASGWICFRCTSSSTGTKFPDLSWFWSSITAIPAGWLNPSSRQVEAERQVRCWKEAKLGAARLAAAVMSLLWRRAEPKHKANPASRFFPLAFWLTRLTSTWLNRSRKDWCPDTKNKQPFSFSPLEKCWN